MKISINKNVLESLLINTQYYTEKKDFSQIISHILFIAKDDELVVKATDHEIGIEIETRNVTILSEGVSTANSGKLLKIVKALKDDEVVLETINESLYIKQKNSKAKLPMFNPNEFPAFPVTENKKMFNINSIKLIQAIKKVTPAIDTNNPKFELNGALLDIKKDKINIVATDTKRLAINSIEFEAEDEFSMIIPKKATNEIQKLFFDHTTIFYDEYALIIKSSNFTFFTKLINGKYPEYTRIIPKQRIYDLKLNREKMLDAMKLASTVSDIIKITFSKDNITFESLNDENFEAKNSIEADFQIQEEISITINSRHIVDFLTNINKNNFILGYNDKDLPYVFESEDFITVVMPASLD